MSTALATIEKITAVEFFKAGASAPLLESLKDEVRAICAELDVSKPKDRDTMRSLAARLGKTKNKVDDLGKELVSDEKKRLKLIDQERSTVWDEFEALQKEARKPLTDWEDAEKFRIAEHERLIAEMIELGTIREVLGSEAVKIRALAVQAAFERDWQEFGKRAGEARGAALLALKTAHEDAKKREEEAAELARLRAESVAREQKEREERIAREAKEQAEREAKEREEHVARETAKREAEAERLKAEAVAGVEQEKADADRRVREAEERAQAAQAKAEQDANDAAERAERDRLAAVEAERKRQADAKAAEEAATAKRESNRKHAAKINREVRESLILVTDEKGNGMLISEPQATAIVMAIAKGLIPHTKINY